MVKKYLIFKLKESISLGWHKCNIGFRNRQRLGASRIFLIIFGLCLLFLGCSAKNGTDKLVIYTSMNLEDMSLFTQRFSDLTGDEVEIWESSGTNVVARTIEEAKAKKLKADILVLNLQRMSVIEKEEILIPYQEKNWHPFLMQYITLAYNISEIDNPPKTYGEIFNPQYKGKLAMEIDTVEWQNTLEEVLGEEFFATLENKLRNREIIGIDGRDLLADMVVAGEIPIAINLGNNYVEMRKKKGAPIEWVPLEPVVSCSYTVALVSESDKAKKFIDFMVSKEAQKIVVEINKGAPIDETIDSPLYTGFERIYAKFAY